MSPHYTQYNQMEHNFLYNLKGSGI